MSSANISHRLVWLSGQTILPAMKMLGRDHFARALPELPLHAHAGLYEVCYIASGKVDWWVEQEIYEVASGELFITRPDERHGGVDAMMHPCKLYWLQIALEELRQDFPQAAALGRAFGGMRWRTYDASPTVAEYFELLVREHQDRSAMSALAAQGALVGLLVQILRDHDRHEEAMKLRSAKISTAIGHAMGWMEAHREADYFIEEAAEAAGLSSSQFHERFRREVGSSPGEWRALLRIRWAKQLLRTTNRAITEIALETGFASSQYFATTFKQYVGVAPRDYRRRFIGPHATITAFSCPEQAE